MDNALYGIFILAVFGLPVAAIVFAAFCIKQGDISLAYVKFSVLVLLWIAGGTVFSIVIQNLMAAQSEIAGHVAAAIYLVLSVLVYLVARKEGRE